MDAVISWMKRRHDFCVEKDWIVPTPGVVSAIKICVNAFTHKEDAIIINKPVYYPFDASIVLNDRKVVENPMIYKDGHYIMDYELFEQSIIDHQVKMFILCNPYNPIGKVWKQEELQKIGDICQKHHVMVIADEIHQDFVYRDHTHIPFYNVDETFKNFSIILTAPSKTFNLAGLQTSNIIIANEELRTKYKDTMVRCGISEPHFLGAIACETAYNECELWVDEMLEYVYDNFMYFDEFLKSNLPHIHLIEPEGLYLAWVDFRECGFNKDELEKIMVEKAGLWLDEGYIFGTGGEGFERFNLAVPRTILEDACQRLLKAFQK
ncbi:MAG: MalY/PatB family protein [Faecalibacillus sp.]